MRSSNCLNSFHLAFLSCVLALPASAQPATHSQEARWWKGNLHTHSLWSDGDDYPEMIAAWYKQHGYHFLALSDHNITLDGLKWSDPQSNRGGTNAFKKYLDRFGPAWVETKTETNRTLVRLKPLSEFRPLFEEPEKFLLIPGEEITDRHLDAPVHINATNLRDLIPPQGGSNVLDVMQRNVNAVLEQRRKTGRPMFPHLNHPNFGWGVTAEQLMRVQGERFFEVYNGHPSVHNEGDSTHASTERMWDIVLTWRHAILEMETMFGIAVDDSHNYHQAGPNQSNPGRGWVMVRATHLTPQHIVHAMETGDFYSSTGVTLSQITRSQQSYSIEIQPEPGVTYTTEFVGTLNGFDNSQQPIRSEKDEPLPVTHRYSQDVGKILARVTGPRPSYTPTGNEIYVRAKITSSKPKENPYRRGEVECAWTQPWVRETPVQK